MYYYGKGCDVDYLKAMKYYQLAAKQGNANAQNQLGSNFVPFPDMPYSYLQQGLCIKLGRDVRLITQKQ